MTPTTARALLAACALVGSTSAALALLVSR